MSARVHQSELAPAEIGRRVRVIRRRRGLGLETAAGLAGMSRAYLEDLAAALGCSVVDLTGQPYLPPDRDSADALATLPAISVALYDTTLDDVADIPARPLRELVRWAGAANEYTANSRYSLAGRHLGPLLAELHVHAVTGVSESRRQALAALTEACFVAAGCARSLGNLDLAVQAARRGADAAHRLADPALCAFASMTSTGVLSRLGARYRAEQVAVESLATIESYIDPTAEDTAAAESAGMLHLSSAQLAAKNHQAHEADAHIAAARELAERTGERNRLQFSFGPANVRAWSLSVAVELERGPSAAERIEATDDYEQGLVTACRRSALHFDLARGFAQAEGDRDTDALRHLDIADRVAPQKIRHDPVAHELLAELDTRARRRAWELDSLKHRMAAGSRIVKG